MKKGQFAIVILTICLILTSLGCASQAQAPAPTAAVHEGKALVESRCSTCHGLNMVEVSKKDQKGWQATVERMVLAGAQLNEEQQNLVIDYLANTYAK